MVQLNRERTSNSMTMGMVRELPVALQALDDLEHVRAVLFTAKGKNFCAGLDFSTMQEITGNLLGGEDRCPAKSRREFLRVVQLMQARSALPLAHT
jgi:enoyl-CoA hydratase/carnithine racemase